MITHWINVCLMVILLPIISTEYSPYTARGFRPSQPDPIRTQIPAKQYGPPSPEYGVPTKPDDTVELTTQPNNIRGVPSKFNNQNFQNIGQSQNFPFRNQNGNNFAFPPNQFTEVQQLNQQNAQLYQQGLPQFGYKLFRPQQSINKFNVVEKLQAQQLPYSVRAYRFDEQRSSAQSNNFLQNRVLPSNTFNGRNRNVQIQQSQQLPLKQFGSRSRSSDNNMKDFNFNNQNSINLQTSILPGLIGVPQQKPTTKSTDLVQNQNLNQFSSPDSQVEILKGQLSSDGLFGAKRASSPRRGGKVTPAPTRQYVPPPTMDEPIPTSSTRRRRPTTTEIDEIENVPVTRRPNVSIANAFAGRLFLLLPDGRLEPVILKRANSHGSDAFDNRIVTAAELTQPLFNPVPLLTF